jgi:DNA polymerase IV
MRFIAHLDMDAFYASVELLRRPELKGLPLVIGGRRAAASGEMRRLGDYVGRGVVTTATYEARRFGVHSGMGLMKAARLAPDAALLPADFDEYRRYSRRFKDAVRAIAPEIEDRGIDEIYIDLTRAVADAAADGAPDPWVRARVIATDLQRAVREATGLTCSIGVTPNKLLSKLASELDKPHGLTIVTEADVPARIWPLAVGRMNGVGPKAAARLEALGLDTIGELARADPRQLVGHFGGSYGAWLHEAAQGRDDRPVVTNSEPKSLSRETTFERDLHTVRDRDQLSVIFTGLCEKLAGDLRRKGCVGRTIGVKVRFEDFSIVTRDHTLNVPTGDAGAIRRAAGMCLKRVVFDRRIRLIGVRIGTLSRTGGSSPVPALFEPAPELATDA